MVNRYVIYRDAVYDLTSIVKYIEHNLLDPSLVLAFWNTFEERVQSIMSFPYQYPVVKSDKIELDGLRKCVFNEYIIIYHIDATLQRIDIVRVFHSKSNYL